MSGEKRRSTARAIAWCAVPAFALAAVACSGSSSNTSTDTQPGTTAAAPTTSAAPGTTTPAADAQATEKFDKEEQEALKTVGCYTGAIDGILGPQTDAALVSFQKAEGLTPDGILGTQTQAALLKAAKAGTSVCGGATTTTAAAGTTSTTGAASGPACTAVALGAALPSGSAVTAFVCSGKYAALTAQSSANPGGAAYILQTSGSTWAVIPQDQVCGAASAGLPPIIIQDGCPKSGGSSGTAVATTSTTK